MQKSPSLIPKLEARLNLEIDLSNNFSEYWWIQINPTYTFKDSSVPNIQMDLESLPRCSSTNHDYVRSSSLIQFFIHCEKLKYFFHFNPTSQYCLLTSSIVESKYRTSTHLERFPLCMVEDQMTMGYKDTLHWFHSHLGFFLWVLLSSLLFQRNWSRKLLLHSHLSIHTMWWSLFLLIC